MTVIVTHSVTSSTPNDPTKEVSSNAWNAGHVVVGLGSAAEQPISAFEAAGSAAAAVAAHAVVHAPATAQANADITKAEIEAKLTGVIASHSHAGGGSDPWTYLVVGSDFTTSSATAVDVTGLAFTPTALLRYEIEVQLMVRTATATVGPRPGMAWPTGLTDGVGSVTRQTSSTTTNVFANGNIVAAILAPVGGLPNTNASWPAEIKAAFTAGAAPSGTFRVQLASETAATNVTVKAGSFMKYRTY